MHSFLVWTWQNFIIIHFVRTFCHKVFAKEGILNVLRIFHKDLILLWSPSYSLLGFVWVIIIKFFFFAIFSFCLTLGCSYLGLEAANTNFLQISVSSFPQHHQTIVFDNNSESFRKLRSASIRQRFD